MTLNPREVKPFEEGDSLSASKFDALRKGASKRIRGLLGRENSTSAASAQTDQSIRERLEVYTQEFIDSYSLFAVKKSSRLDYVWEASLRFELNKFEFGLSYATNLDFPLHAEDEEWCEIIGELPVLIRYDEGDGIPRVGHPIGPKGDGSVSIKRCGFVVHAEPDTENKRVWIVRSNDQMVRVKLARDIKPNEREHVFVLGEMPCVEQGCTAEELEECEPTRPKDPNDIDSSTDFVLHEVLNLTGKTLAAGQVLTAHPTLGLGYAIMYDNPDQFRVEAIECHYPEEEGFYYLEIFDLEEDDWVRTGAQDLGNGEITWEPIKVYDKAGRVMLLPGEVHDVQPTFNQCGFATWNFIGSYGLTRQAKVGLSKIECYATGEVSIMGHELSNCDGVVFCGVTACNGQTGEEGRRTIYPGETVTVIFFETVWKILPQPHETEWLGTLTSNMCPNDAIGKVQIDETLEYCTGIVDASQKTDADNLFNLSGTSGKRVLLGAHSGEQGEPTLFIKQVEHECYDVTVADKCQSDGIFIKEGDCEILGHVLPQTSIMSCTPQPTWVQQIQLHEHVVLANAALHLNGCALELNGQADSFCTFGTQEADPPLIPLSSATFETTEVYSELNLEYDAGDSVESCDEFAVYTYTASGWVLTTPCPEGCTLTDPAFPEEPEIDDTVEVTCERPDPCASPSLKLTGKKASAVTCSSNGQEPETEEITSLPLTETTAYYDTSEDANCLSLIPHSFTVFGECDIGTPEQILCVNPCPTDTSTAGTGGTGQ